MIEYWQEKAVFEQEDGAQQLAQPVLNDLKAWLEKNRTRVPRDSLTYKAT